MAKPEDFIVETGERGEAFLTCPKGRCRWETDAAEAPLGELIASAREHLAQAHGQKVVAP